uniref:Uncharacterized protein n=1 Tax=Odontella aurita TaxID=265563 RepID=A0A7S4KA50_9STRA
MRNTDASTCSSLALKHSREHVATANSSQSCLARKASTQSLNHASIAATRQIPLWIYRKARAKRKNDINEVARQDGKPETRLHVVSLTMQIPGLCDKHYV